MDLRMALAAVLAAWLLVACDDDPEPKVEDPTPSVTSEPREPSTTTSSPADLDPEAVVRAWVDAWNAARLDGDTSSVHALETRDCQGCDELVGPGEDILAAGGAFEGGDWRVITAKVTNQTKRRAEVGLAIEIAAGTTTPSSGAPATTYPASKHLLKVALEMVDGSWRIADMELLS